MFRATLSLQASSKMRRTISCLLGSFLCYGFIFLISLTIQVLFNYALLLLFAIDNCVTLPDSCQSAGYVQDTEHVSRLALTVVAWSLTCSLNCANAAFLELITVLAEGRFGFIWMDLLFLCSVVYNPPGSHVQANYRL